MMYRRQNHKLFLNAGFSLIELLIVIAILGIVGGASALGFNSWVSKNRVESQTRQIATDLGELRIRAMTQKLRHSVTFNATEYVFRSYSSENESLTAGGTVIPSGTKSVRFRLKQSTQADYDGTVRYEIDTRGILQTPTSIYLDYASSAVVDCIDFDSIRINAGKTRVNGVSYVCDTK